MKAEIKELWLAELRSGRRQQGQDTLRRGERECCLGVLCDLAAIAGLGRWEEDDDSDRMRFVSAKDERDWSLGTLPEIVQDWAGIGDDDPEALDDHGNPVRLSNLNDSGWSFEGIADLIERGL